MKVWNAVIWDTAIAKTAGTFDDVNNNVSQIKIANPTAKAIYGFYVNYACTVVTDAEVRPDLIIEITSKALGISGEQIVVALGTNDGDAVSRYTPVTSVFVPFKEPITKQNLFNADLSFKASASATTTGGLDVGIQLVYGDFEPTQNFMTELMSGSHKRVTGGDYQADAAKAFATGGAAVNLTSLSIPTGRTMLLGLLGSIIPNGITASDPISGFMEFQSSGIPDFAPQEILLSRFFDPALGTVTSGKSAIARAPYQPTRFTLTGAETTVVVKGTLIVAAATAPDTTQALLYE